MHMKCKTTFCSNGMRSSQFYRVVKTRGDVTHCTGQGQKWEGSNISTEASMASLAEFSENLL